MRLIVIAAAAVLSGCVTSKPVSLPNGKQGYAISCDGTAQNISACMNHAGKLCGGPYTVVNRDESSSGALGMPNGMGGYTVMQAQHRTLIVQCGAE